MTPGRLALTLGLASLLACHGGGDDGDSPPDAAAPDGSGPAIDASIDAPPAVDTPFDLDLGHVDNLQTLVRQGDRALSVDDSSHWVLWDLPTRTQVASGEAIVCPIQFPCAPPRAYLRGGLLAIRTATGLELRSATTGAVTGTVATATIRIGVASDGSYAWAATATGLHAWHPDGSALITIAGNYGSAIVFGAPTELRIGAGPAGATMLETIRIADSMRSTAVFNGSFHSWFLDGERFLTVTGQVVRVYSRAGASVGFGMMPSLDELAGDGDRVWTHALATGNPLRIYAATDLDTPLETDLLAPSDVVMAGAGTLGVIHKSAAKLEVITLGAPLTHAAPVPLPSDTYVAYGADADGWLAGTRWGAIVTGAGNALGPVLARGRVSGLRATAGGDAAIATESSSVFLVHVDETPILFRALPLRPSHLELSADGATLVAAGPTAAFDPVDLGLRVFSTTTGATIHEWPYRYDAQDSFVDFAYAPATATLVHYLSHRDLSNYIYSRQWTTLDGAPLADYGPTPTADTTGLRGVHLFSPDGTRAAVTPAYQYPSEATTRLYHAGAPVEIVDGVALGWLADDRLLVCKYRPVGGMAVQTFVSNTVYSGDGVVIATSALPEIRPVESTLSRLRGTVRPIAGGLVYVPSKNAVYDPATGGVVWQGAAGTIGGDVAGDFVVYRQAQRIVIERYRP